MHTTMPPADRSAVPAATTPSIRPPGGGGVGYCTGTFDNTTSVAHLQESKTSIPWGTFLDSSQAYLGEVHFSNVTYALNQPWNGYQPHAEFWDYTFHSALPNPFQAENGKKYTYHTGDEISFAWDWYSVADPNEGDYAYVNCIYDPSVN